MRLSVLFGGFGGLEETVAVVQAADKAKLDGVWSAEHLGFHDAVVPSATYLALTEHIEIGLVGLGTAGRHPGLMAMELMSLSELGPGRIRVQVGTGAAPLVAQLGREIIKPVMSTHGFVTSLREACAGRDMRVEHRDFKFEGFRLNPLGPVPAIDVMAIRPRMTELAGQIGDGLSISVGASFDYMKASVERVEQAIEKAGRDRSAFRITAHVIAAIAEDLDPYRASVAGMLATFPQETAAILAVGAVDGEELVRTQVEQGPMAVMKLYTPDVIEKITLMATPATLANKLSEYAAIGIDEIALMLLNPVEEQAAVVRKIGQARSAI